MRTNCREDELHCNFSMSYRGTSLKRNRPPPLGPLKGLNYRPSVGFREEALSYERGTPVESMSGSMFGSSHSSLDHTHHKYITLTVLTHASPHSAAVTKPPVHTHQSAIEAA